MALIKFLKRKKEQIDKAIPDFNIRQRAGQAVKSVGRTVSNIERGSQQFGGAQRNRLDSALAAQRQRQAEQANLRREREAEARARKLEQSQRRLDDLRAKQEQRNRQREENNRTRQENINKLTTGAKKTAGWLAKQAFEIPTIQNVYQRGLDAKLAENAFNQSTKLQEAAAKTTDANKKARLLKVSEQIKQPYVGQVGKDKNLKPQEFAKAGLEANLNILSFIPGLQGTAGLKGVSVASKAGKGAKLASKAGKGAKLAGKVKQAINLSLGGGQGVGFIDDLSKIGTSKAIKNLVGRNLASGTTTAAVKQISTPETKDMTVTDKLKQFATDVPINTLAGTVFEGGLGLGAKGASDLVSGVSKKVAPALSRAKESIASALQEPKFKPGFASTKPKVGLEPKQPKANVDTNKIKPEDLADFNRLIKITENPVKQGATGLDMMAQNTKNVDKSLLPWNFDTKQAGIEMYNLLFDVPELRPLISNKTYNLLESLGWDISRIKQVKTQPTITKKEAPVVKIATIKEKKPITQLAKEVAQQPKIEGFTPAPEVKKPKASSTKSLIKEAQEKLQTKTPTADANIVIKSKNPKVPDLTKADIDQIARNTKATNAQIETSYGQVSAIKEGAEKPINNVQASLTSFIRNPKKWEQDNVKPQKSLSSEEFVPTKPRTEAEQKELQSAINKAREQSQFLQSKQSKPEVSKPTIKLATKKSPKELAEEAINRQDTQKVVSEKVFGKEPEIPSTPQQRTQFEINQAKRDAAIPQIKAVSKSEADRIKQERVRKELPEIDIGRTQEETNKIIREKVFKKEPEIPAPKPVVKLRTTTAPRTPRELAEETVQRATKEPISPEIPSVARVSTKEDISVGGTPELNDRFPIKTPASGKTRIDYDELIDFGIKINDDKSKNVLKNRIGLEAERIGAEYTKKTGKGFDKFVDELESGKLDNRVLDLYDEVSNLFNAGNRISTIRNNQITGNIANYFRRIKKGGLEKILTEGSQKNVADILYTPGFGKKRTGALVEYEKTPSVLVAYFDEAVGPISSEQNALVRTANQIKNQIDKSEIVDKNGVIKPTSSIKYVQTIKDNIRATAQNKYNDVRKAIIPGLRSVKNRVFQLADKKFYDDFLKPFNNAQRDYNNALQDATKLSEKNVRSLAEGLGIKIPEKASKDQMLQRIAGEYKKQYYGPATETFIKNVANADIKEPNGLQLLEDIAETYIGTEVKKNKFIDKLTGEIRLAYARGALGLNVGSAINNVLELKKVLSRSGIGNTVGAIKDYMAGIDLRNKYGVATTSNIFQDEAFNLLKKVDPVLFSLFDFTENAKNKLFLSSLEKLGKKKGLQGDDLEYFVLKNFEQYGLAGGRAEDIGLFTGGKRPLTKTAFQFLQYPIKDTVAFADALSNGLKKAVKDKKLNEDLSYAITYGITSVAQMAILSQIIGQKGFGSQSGFTPFDFLKQVTSGDVTGPGADAILKLGTWVYEIMQPESDKKEEKVREAQKDMNRTFLMGIVPTFNQTWNRTGRYIQDRNRGYFETGSGNVANLVTDDTWGAIRGYILGGSYDPERQKYFVESQKSKSPNLGKEESAVFKQLKEKGGIEKAKEFFAGIMSKRETDKALKDLEEGAGITKPEGMTDEKWIETQATNEVLLSNDMVPNDVLVQYYGRNVEFGKSGSERTKNETKVFNLINTLNDNDKFNKLSDEQKDNIESSLMEKAGITKDTVEYYNKAKNTVVVKYQIALEEIAQKQAEDPNFDVINYLVQGRKKINTQVFASQDVLKMLEEDGIITEDEYKVLNKTNFLYLDGEFKDRSVAVELKGSGKGSKDKKPPKITLSRLMAGQQRLSDTQKIKGNLELVKLKSKPRIAAINLKRQVPDTVLRLAPVRKVKPKKLTIKNIRVK